MSQSENPTIFLRFIFGFCLYLARGSNLKGRGSRKDKKVSIVDLRFAFVPVMVGVRDDEV